MKLRKVFLIAVLSGIAFTSCKNKEQVEEESIEMDRMEAEIDAEMMSDESMENNMSARIRDKENLSIFSESMDRNQITQNWEGTNVQSTTTNRGTTAGQSQSTSTTAGKAQKTTTEPDTSRQGTMTGQGHRAGMGKSYTIFAPTDDAYNSLTETQRNDMMNMQNMERNTASMNYLMVEQRLTEDGLRQQIQNAKGTYQIKTMQGENITATLDGQSIVLKDAAGNEARITESDSSASDGVVHLINKVLMPQDPGKNAAIKQSGTTKTSTNKTSTGNTNTEN